MDPCCYRTKHSAPNNPEAFLALHVAAYLFARAQLRPIESAVRRASAHMGSARTARADHVAEQWDDSNWAPRRGCPVAKTPTKKATKGA